MSAGLERVAVIIPALDEADNLRALLPVLRNLGLRQIIVADNGSHDETGCVVREHAAMHVSAPIRGYGSACFTGMRHLAPEIEIVVFLDADLSDDASFLPELVAPIRAGAYDLVIGARVPALRVRGAMAPAQIVGNILATAVIRAGWGHRYRDLGPFRAIRRGALEQIGMRDRAYGWTVEMQIRAIEEGLRILEVPVPYRRRKGRSKISGTVRGVLRAAHGILGTCVRLWWTRPARTPPRV
jgi:glycosyltransferase involved in cell wall biosynthesis